MDSLQKAKKELYQHLQSIIIDQCVLNAFLQVPREAFVPNNLRDSSYADIPLPIPGEQTISQPTTVLLMTEFLQVKPGQHVLEIGTGSGYQAAILSVVVGRQGTVTTVEIVDALYQYSTERLKAYKNVHMMHGDGSKGYAQKAPYDRIIITAACPTLPTHLLAQLRDDGLLLAPVGDLAAQRMIRMNKQGETEDLGRFLFVPLTGNHGFQEET